MKWIFTLFAIIGFIDTIFSLLAILDIVDMRTYVFIRNKEKIHELDNFVYELYEKDK